MLITTPNPGTISLPFGILVATVTSFFSAELDADKVVVELADVTPVSNIVVVPFTSVDGVVTVAVRSCAIADSTDAIDLLITELGFVGLIGLIGLVGLLMFVAVITHVFPVSTQSIQVGVPYGSEQTDDLLCVIFPLYPD
jgi:hypothetical protein